MGEEVDRKRVKVYLYISHQIILCHHMPQFQVQNLVIHRGAA